MGGEFFAGIQCDLYNNVGGVATDIGSYWQVEFLVTSVNLVTILAALPGVQVTAGAPVFFWTHDVTFGF